MNLDFGQGHGGTGNTETLTLDGGIVFVNEMALNELNSQSRLSDTWRKP